MLATRPSQRPVGSEEDRGESDHHPREQPDLEQRCGDGVEHHHRHVRPRPRAPPQQPADDRQVEQHPCPAEGERHVRFVEPGTDQRPIGAGRQPDPHRLPVQQPVGVELGQPGEDVDDGELRPQRPDRDRRDRPVPTRLRHDRQHDRGERHEPVVVEVERGVDQLEVGEADRERRGAGARPPADRDRRRRAHRARRRGRTSAGRAAGVPTRTWRRSGDVPATDRTRRPNPATAVVRQLKATRLPKATRKAIVEAAGTGRQARSSTRSVPLDVVETVRSSAVAVCIGEVECDAELGHSVDRERQLGRLCVAGRQLVGQSGRRARR